MNPQSSCKNNETMHPTWKEKKNKNQRTERVAAGVAKRRALLSPSISGYQEEMYYTFVRTNRERPYLPHENSDSNAIGAIRDRSRRLRAFLYLTSRGRARPVYYVEAYFGRLHYWAWVI